MKLITFSLWGDSPKYCIGALKNAELAKTIYPGWTCRFYLGTSVPREIVHKLAAMDNTHIVCMNVAGDWRGMFWRFEAASDPDCEVMISRDCDSRLGLREKAAVDEWMVSDKGFHTIHDHFHHNVPILGGLWGKKRDCFPEFSIFLDAWHQEDRWQTDQDFLTQVVWPRVANQTMNHSEFHTHIWPARPIPLPRSGREFIGATYNEHDIIDVEQQRLLYGR
jgi:hypothetical protein